MPGSDGLRRGSPISFWGTLPTLGAGAQTPAAVAVLAGATSPAVQLGRGTNLLTVFVNASGASTFQLQGAHVGAFSGQGVVPDATNEAFIWHDVWYLGTTGLGNSTSAVISGAAAFSIASLIPDFEIDWIRLKRTDAGGSVNVIAGHEAWGS